MIQKIQSNDLLSAVRRSSGQTEKTDSLSKAQTNPAAAEKAVKSYASVKRDTIELSHTRVNSSPSLVQIRSSMTDELKAETNPERLAELRSQIKAGTYAIEAQKIARAMILGTED